MKTEAKGALIAIVAVMLTASIASLMGLRQQQHKITSLENRIVYLEKEQANTIAVFDALLTKPDAK